MVRPGDWVEMLVVGLGLGLSSGSVEGMPLGTWVRVGVKLFGMMGQRG